MLGECFQEAWGGLGSFVLCTLGLSGQAWEAWGMLGNASGKLGEAWGGLGNAWERFGEALGRLGECFGEAWGGLGKAWGMLGECFQEAWGGLLYVSTLGLSGDACLGGFFYPHSAWGGLGNA